VFTFINSNNQEQLQPDPYSNFDWIIAAGIDSEFSYSENTFESLKKLHDDQQSWLFGLLSYDLKNEIENLSSGNFDGIQSPTSHFYSPQNLVISKDSQVAVLKEKEGLNARDFFSAAIADDSATDKINSNSQGILLRQRISKSEYTKTVEEIKQHIQRGDIYEMNYCIEFFAENAVIDPYRMYSQLNALSPSPFSCFYRNRDTFLTCASPERFMAKRGSKIISQPIKGTIRRGKTSEEDEQLKSVLRNDPKEQSENVMIVDLVRNDLSRSAKKGSVVVEELFGIHTFRQLHQMISTVVSEMKEDLHFTDVIRHAFPMGSMTGAPKIRAMQLIEKYEQTKRGMYSGSIGYCTPEGDFDFNVIIRSILYNHANRYLSFMVGSAITVHSDAEKEYEECLLKAKAMLEILNAGQPVSLNQL